MASRLQQSAPLVIAVGGLVATGKSHVARALGDELAAEVVEADRIRDALLGSPSDSHESGWGRSFGPDFAAEVYGELERRAESAVRAGRAVVLDACFPQTTRRGSVLSLARRLGGSFLFVECTVDARTRRDRLAARDAEKGGAGWTFVAEELARDWEPVGGLAGVEHQTLDTARPVAEAVADVAMRLAERRAPAPPSDGVIARPGAVTFDCWATLILEPSWRAAHALRVAALAEAAAEAGRPVQTDVAGQAFNAAWGCHMRLWSEGVATGAAEVAAWALAELGLPDPHPAREHLTRSFEEASLSSRVEALPGARQTLELLASAGVRRALVCDTGLTSGRVVRLHLERLGLLELLEVLVFSDELGVPKPDPRAFLTALDALGVSPRRSLHVGDMRRTDVAGARGVGMPTARIRARNDDVSSLPEADHVVESHLALQNLLGRSLARGTT